MLGAVHGGAPAHGNCTAWRACGRRPANKSICASAASTSPRPVSDSVLVRRKLPDYLGCQRPRSLPVLICQVEMLRCTGKMGLLKAGYDSKAQLQSEQGRVPASI